MGNIQINIAGISAQITIVYPKTQKYFKKYTAEENVIGRQLDFTTKALSEEAIAQEASRLSSDLSFAEFSLLLEQVANPVLRHDRFFFHGAAFIWHDRAFLFTGKSGTGKSTQLKHWLSLFPEETEVINGDKPVIEQRGKSFIVHPSPWTGKEGLNGSHSAELGGIILLEQGDQDEFFPLEKKKAVFPLFLQFLYKAEDRESVELVCGYESALLNNAPVFKLINTGTKESALLTRDRLIREGF